MPKNTVTRICVRHAENEVLTAHLVSEMTYAFENGAVFLLASLFTGEKNGKI